MKLRCFVVSSSAETILFMIITQRKQLVSQLLSGQFVLLVTLRLELWLTEALPDRCWSTPEFITEFTCTEVSAVWQRPLWMNRVSASDLLMGNHLRMSPDFLLSQSVRTSGSLMTLIKSILQMKDNNIKSIKMCLVSTNSLSASWNIYLMKQLWTSNKQNINRKLLPVFRRTLFINKTLILESSGKNGECYTQNSQL